MLLAVTILLANTPSLMQSNKLSRHKAFHACSYFYAGGVIQPCTA